MDFDKRFTARVILGALIILIVLVIWYMGRKLMSVKSIIFRYTDLSLTYYRPEHISAHEVENTGDENGLDNSKLASEFTTEK